MTVNDDSKLVTTLVVITYANNVSQIGNHSQLWLKINTYLEPPTSKHRPSKHLQVGKSSRVGTQTSHNRRGSGSITASHSVIPEVVPARWPNASCPLLHFKVDRAHRVSNSSISKSSMLFRPPSPLVMIPVCNNRHFPRPILEMPHCIHNDVYPPGK